MPPAADDSAQDDGPTTIDPEVPGGVRGRFDPHASGDDERRTVPRAATAPPLIDDPALAPELAPRTTVIGKRAANVGARPGPARADDSNRTTKWEPAELQATSVRVPPSPAKGLPLQPGPRSEPLRVVSMKTPADVEAEHKAQRPIREVRLRAMSDVHQTPPRGMGNLAPPRDAKEARSRRRRDNVIWGSVAVIVAAVVMLTVWFLAR